jgi:soluble lytic murein transglycosylase-like protein
MQKGCGAYVGDPKKLESKYSPLIEKIAKEEGVDPKFIKSIVKAESSFNPNARSKKGAMGLMQLMPATAREMGVQNPFDPEQNLRGGIKYYKKMLRAVGGDNKLALAAYNAGLGSVRKAKGIPKFGETLAYVPKIMNFYSA